MADTQEIIMDVIVEKIRTDGGTQPRTYIDESVVSEYAEAMANGAEFPPAVVFWDGVSYWLADGFHRLHAYRRAEADTIPAEVHKGTRRDAILYSVGANSAHGLRRTNEDKRRAVETLLQDEEWGLWSDREIARRCGVDHKTVSKWRAELTGENPQSDPESLSHRTYTTRHGTEAVMNTGNIGRQASAADNDDISSSPETLPPSSPPASTGSFHVSTGEVEWYTPGDFIAQVREVMGGIDTDPASSDMAQETVQASTYYTRENDGLAQAWAGRVFVNPPYAMPDIEAFADRAVRAADDGECEQMIVLVNNATDTDWFHRLLSSCDRMCLTDGRVKFYNNEGKTLGARQGQAVFYFGADTAIFHAVFSRIGAVLAVLET